MTSSSSRARQRIAVAQIRPHKALHLNELDPLRRERYYVFPEATISGEDGATINSALAAAERPSLILHEPAAFSRSSGAAPRRLCGPAIYRLRFAGCRRGTSGCDHALIGSGPAPGCATSTKRCCAMSPSGPRCGSEELFRLQDVDRHPTVRDRPGSPARHRRP